MKSLSEILYFVHKWNHLKSCFPLHSKMAKTGMKIRKYSQDLFISRGLVSPIHIIELYSSDANAGFPILSKTGIGLWLSWLYDQWRTVTVRRTEIILWVMFSGKQISFSLRFPASFYVTTDAFVVFLTYTLFLTKHRCSKF